MIIQRVLVVNGRACGSQFDMPEGFRAVSEHMVSGRLAGVWAERIIYPRETSAFSARHVDSKKSCAEVAGQLYTGERV